MADNVWQRMADKLDLLVKFSERASDERGIAKLGNVSNQAMEAMKGTSSKLGSSPTAPSESKPYKLMSDTAMQAASDKMDRIPLATEMSAPIPLKGEAKSSKKKSQVSQEMEDAQRNVLAKSRKSSLNTPNLTAQPVGPDDWKDVPEALKVSNFEKIGMKLSGKQLKGGGNLGPKIMEGAQHMHGTGTKADQIGEMADLAQTGARAAAGDPMAIAQLGKKVIEKVKEKIGQMKAGFEELGNAFKSEKVGDIASSTGRSMQQFGKATGIKGVEHMGKFVEFLGESLEKLRGFSQALHDSNMRFAEFSGAMASVEAQQEVRDIQLSRERGNRRAESAETLAQGKHRLEKSMAPLEDTWANMKNWFVAWFDNKLAGVFEALGKWLNLEEGIDQNEVLDSLESIQKRWLQNRGNPGRWADNTTPTNRF